MLNLLLEQWELRAWVLGEAQRCWCEGHGGLCETFKQGVLSRVLLRIFQNAVSKFLATLKVYALRWCEHNTRT